MLDEKQKLRRQVSSQSVAVTKRQLALNQWHEKPINDHLEDAVTQWKEFRPVTRWLLVQLGSNLGQVACLSLSLTSDPFTKESDT